MELAYCKIILSEISSKCTPDRSFTASLTRSEDIVSNFDTLILMAVLFFYIKTYFLFEFKIFLLNITNRSHTFFCFTYIIKMIKAAHFSVN